MPDYNGTAAVLERAAANGEALPLAEEPPERHYTKCASVHCLSRTQEPEREFIAYRVRGEERYYCRRCADAYIPQCACCRERKSARSMTQVDTTGLVCRDCYENRYRQCDRCGNHRHRELEEWRDVDGSAICRSCQNRYYFTCRECEQFMLNDYRGQGHPDGRYTCRNCVRGKNYSFCKPVVPQFSIAGYHCDTRMRIDMEVGCISKAGIRAINDFLLVNGLRALDKYFSTEWVNGDGGFTKRVKRYLYKTYKVKISESQLTEIGNIASEHRETQDHYWVDFTRDLDWKSGEYGDGGSCYWQSYTQARCMIKRWGGFAIRTYESETGKGTGRAWVFPIRRTQYSTMRLIRDDGWGTRRKPYWDHHHTIDQQWTPCHGMEEAEAFLVFNGYGHPTGTFTRILTKLTGLDYSEVEFTQSGWITSSFYINGNRGDLVGPPELLEKCERVSITIDTDCKCRAGVE